MGALGALPGLAGQREGVGGARALESLRESWAGWWLRRQPESQTPFPCCCSGDWVSGPRNQRLQSL